MKPEERDEGIYNIVLKQNNGNLLPAQVELGCRDWNDAGRRNTECRIQLSWADSEIQAVDWNFFAAFQSIRQTLALQELLPVCYGASRKVVISGMLMDWSLGLQVYRVGEDGNLRQEDVCIFESGEDVEPVSVEVQKEFQDKWLKEAMPQIPT